MATNKDSLSEKLLGGFEGTKNTLNTTKLAKTIAQSISKRLSTIGNSGKFLGGKTVGKIDTALYTSISEGQYQRLRRGDGVADVAAKLVNLIILSDEEKKLHHELDRNFEQEELDEAKKLKEVDIEPETIAELDDKNDRKIFDNYDKLDLVTRLGKLWFWSKNIVKWVSGKVIRFSVRAAANILGGRAKPFIYAVTAGYMAYKGTEKQQEYFKTVHANILKAATEQGLSHPDVIATIGATQSSLETGFGKSVVGNNLFGIKGVGPAGFVLAPTKEDVGGGKLVTVMGKFKAFESTEQSAEGYVDFLVKNKRYKKLLDAGSIAEALPALIESKYATDESYFQKLSKILKKVESVNPEKTTDNTVPEKNITEISKDNVDGIKLNNESINYNNMLDDEQFKQNMLILNNNNTIIQPVNGVQTSMSSSTSPDPNLYELSTMMVYPDGQ